MNGERTEFYNTTEIKNSPFSNRNNNFPAEIMINMPFLKKTKGLTQNSESSVLS